MSDVRDLADLPDATLVLLAGTLGETIAPSTSWYTGYKIITRYGMPIYLTNTGRSLSHVKAWSDLPMLPPA